MQSLTEQDLIDYKVKHGLKTHLTLYEKYALRRGMPLQYIAKIINFDDLAIKVKRGVFIPRYETEELVLLAIKHIKSTDRVLDLCAGSGYIGLTIKQKTNAVVTLSDISLRAIRQIKTNAAQSQLDVKIVRSNLFAAIKGQFDVIVSNPPYIKDKTVLPPSVINFEPRRALFGGLDGNDFYRQILQHLPRFLAPQGAVFFELGSDNVKFLQSEGFNIGLDMNGKHRFAWRRYD